jgi:hypothetical protein
MAEFIDSKAMNSTPKKLSLVLSILYILAMSFVLWDVNGEGRINIFLVVIWAWTIFPQLLGTFLISNFKTTRAQTTALVLQTILTGLSAYIYYDSQYVHPDAQGALVFIFIPVWYLIILFVTNLIVWFIQSRYWTVK